MFPCAVYVATLKGFVGRDEELQTAHSSASSSIPGQAAGCATAAAS